MSANPEFASPCGLYCGVCAIYLAHRDNNQKFKEKLSQLYKGRIPGKGTLPHSETLAAEDIRCNGCLSEDRFMHCQQCEIRACCREKGYTGCHQCDAFPCQYIEQFPMAIGKKVILRAVPHRRDVGTDQWMQDEQARYVCPECGNTVFRGVVRCNQCKSPLDLD
jgi:hypothetical protein